MPTVTFNKQETALFLASGDDTLAVSNGYSYDQLVTQLAALKATADNTNDDQLFGTNPDDTVVNIGKAPRRPSPPHA